MVNTGKISTTTGRRKSCITEPKPRMDSSLIISKCRVSPLMITPKQMIASICCSTSCANRSLAASGISNDPGSVWV